MELIQIKIKGTVVTQRYGTLTSGDILRTDTEFARHLVTECGAAEYLNSTTESQESGMPTKQPRGKKK